MATHDDQVDLLRALLRRVSTVQLIKYFTEIGLKLPDNSTDRERLIDALLESDSTDDVRAAINIELKTASKSFETGLKAASESLETGLKGAKDDLEALSATMREKIAGVEGLMTTMREKIAGVEGLMTNITLLGSGAAILATLGGAFGGYTVIQLKEETDKAKTQLAVANVTVNAYREHILHNEELIASLLEKLGRPVG